MVKLSRYTHEYDLGEVKALYHSLRMKPVFLKNETYEDLQEWLASPYCLSAEDAPENIRAEVAELTKYKILRKLLRVFLLWKYIFSNIKHIKTKKSKKSCKCNKIKV